MSAFEIIQSIASIVTSVGVGIAAWQLRLTKQQAQAQFEDSLTAQYREVADRLPLDALLGRRLDDATLVDHLPTFYRYFDLSNEQAFLARRRRLREETWENWQEGIEQHIRRPAFCRRGSGSSQTSTAASTI